MSIKRTWIGVRYWLTKRWRMLYCFLAFASFAFILLTSKNDNYNSQFIISKQQSTVSLRHSLIASNEQHSPVKQASFKSEQQNWPNFLIAKKLNSMIESSWSTINKYYNSYYNQTQNDKEEDSNLITLFRSNKFTKFNEIDFDSNQPILQLNISDELKAQLDLVVRRVIESHENTFNLKPEERLNKNELTIDLIKKILKKQNENKRPLTISYTDQWQPVIGVREKSRVYSAFYESRLETRKFVRVIGAARTANLEPLFCAQWFIDDNKLKLFLTKAINRAIRENWNLKYSAYYLLCPLDDQNVPTAVSILKKKLPKKNEKDTNEKSKDNDALIFHALGNFVLVQNNLKFKRENDQSLSNDLNNLNGQNDKIAICVKPFHYDYNKLDNLIEFIELNKLLGIDHFLFYNHTIGPKVDCLLNQYIKQTDLVTVLSWQNLDMKSQEEIRTEGIFASLNDCVYRTMYRFKYVAMIDLDEFIVPHLDGNLKLLLNRLVNYSVSKDHKAGAFSFKNAFFYLQWPDDPEYLKLANANPGRQANEKSTKNNLPVYLTTLAKTRRRATLHSHRERSKLIVVPDYIVEVGNHFVWQFLPNKHSFHIDEKAAFLHHYRICEFGGTDCLNSPSTIDHRIKNLYSKELIQKSILTFKIYNQTCVF